MLVVTHDKPLPGTSGPCHPIQPLINQLTSCSLLWQTTNFTQLSGTATHEQRSRTISGSISATAYIKSTLTEHCFVYKNTQYMPDGFNISPVIDLLGSFSVVDRATPDPAPSSDALFDTEHAQHADSVRALGDFGALWKFLQTPGREPGPTPPICDDLDTNTYGVSVTVTQPGPPPGAISSEPRKSKTFNVRFAHDAKHADRVANAKQTPVKASGRAKATIPKAPVTPKALVTPKAPVSPKSTSRKVAATSDTGYTPHSPYVKSNVASADKKVIIIEKLMKLYPETRKALLKVRVPGTPVKPPSDSDIHVFVDNSNVSIHTHP